MRFSHLGGAAAGASILETQVDVLRRDDILTEIDAKVDMEQLERVLMEEGVKKFADPQKALLALIAEKRAVLAA